MDPRDYIAPDYITTPLFGVLRAIGYGEHNDLDYFKSHALFWSMERLFGCYERVMSVLELEPDQRPFLGADIESFIIRFQIILNDIAYIIRRLLPVGAQGLPAFKGNVDYRNREVSMASMIDKIQRNGSDYPEFQQILAEASAWLLNLRKNRNDVVHYKAKVIVFESGPPSFAFLASAGTEETVKAEDGSSRVVTIPVESFINGQMLDLHRFLQVTLVDAIRTYAERVGLKYVQIGTDARMAAFGITRFKRVNGFP